MYNKFKLRKYMFNNQIFLQDVVKGLKNLADNSADIIIADPPYNIGKNFGNYSDNLNLDDYILWCNSWVKESLRVLKPEGTLYIYGFSEILSYIFVNTNCNFKKWLIWHYTNKNVAHAQFWQRSHESILLLAKSKPIFNRDDVREPYTDSFLKNSAGKPRTTTKGRFNPNSQETIYNAHEKGALPRDVIKIPALAGGFGLKERAYLCKYCNTFLLGGNERKNHMSNCVNHDILNHPTQKPIALTRKLIAGSKNKLVKNNVVILFSGSGAESIAALIEDCNFIAFDIDSDFCNLGNEWIKYFNKLKNNN